MLFLLSTRIWALESNYYHLAKSVIMSRIEKGQDALDASLAREIPTEMQLIAAPVDLAMLGFDAAAPGASSEQRLVAHIPLVGTMTKRGGMCTRGTAEVGADIRRANADPNIVAIVLEVDSGGGAVDGTEALGAEIANSAKPVVAWVNGMAASAAYWAASQCAEIITNSATTGYVGSIGVLAIHTDQSQLLERNGVKTTIVRSSQATDKARVNSVEPLTEEVLADLQAQLDAVHSQFISTVKSGRGDRLKGGDELFTGKVYSGKEGKKAGLVDSIGSLEDAVRRADQLAKSKTRNGARAATRAEVNSLPTAQESISNQITAHMSFPKLRAFLGLAPEQAEVSAEQLQAAEDRIAAFEVRESALQTQIDSLTASSVELTEQVASLTETNTELQATVTALTTEKETLAGQVNTLEGFRQQAAAIGATVVEDEANRSGQAVVAKEEWEVLADTERAKAIKRNSKK